MTKELIENIRAIIVPYMAHDLRRINYENMGETDAKEFTENMNEILDLATKALEQEAILDKIRAEIEENINYNKKMNYQGIVAGLLLTRNIIDKYKAESEE